MNPIAVKPMQRTKPPIKLEVSNFLSAGGGEAVVVTGAIVVDGVVGAMGVVVLGVMGVTVVGGVGVTVVVGLVVVVVVVVGGVIVVFGFEGVVVGAVVVVVIFGTEVGVGINGILPSLDSTSTKIVDKTTFPDKKIRKMENQIVDFIVLIYFQISQA
uniref:Uncharacterized protein n=1 Tax=Clastoptera arizonana TaxID=38151 RepID=A0A1B6CUK7_9HEMI